MGRNKDELIKLAEKITGQECKDVLTKKDALKKIACHYLGYEKEFASIADCLESIVEHGATGGSGGGGESGNSNGIYKLICKKSNFRFDASGNQLYSGDITEYEGGVIYPLHLISYAIKYMNDLAELPETLNGYSISDLVIENNYRGSTVINVKFSLKKDSAYKQEIEAGLYKIPIHTKLYQNDDNYSFKIGELHIKVLDE